MIMVELDEVIRVGAITVAALVKRSVLGDSVHAVWIHGAKRPVAVLIRCNNVTRAFEIGESEIDWDSFEQRFPGKRAEFERIAISDNSRS